MKKELARLLLDKVFRLQENGHFASIQFSNYGHECSIYCMKGGFEINRDYDATLDLFLDNYKKVLETILALDKCIEEWGGNESEVNKYDTVSD